MSTKRREWIWFADRNIPHYQDPREPNEFPHLYSKFYKLEEGDVVVSGELVRDLKKELKVWLDHSGLKRTEDLLKALKKLHSTIQNT